MFQILLLIVIFQVLFFSVLIITKRNKALSDIFLFIWLLFLAIHLSLIYLSMDREAATLYSYLGFCFSIPHGIFLYLYTQSLTNSSVKLKAIDLLHFTPFVICTLVALFFNDIIGYTIGVRIISILSAFTYIVLSLKDIRKYQNSIKGRYSNIDKINLDWLKHLIYGIIGFCICGFIWGIIPSLNKISLPFNEVFSILILIFINILGYKGIRQNNIIGGTQIVVTEPEQVPPSVSDNIISYAHNGLKETEAKKLAENLKLYMEREKPYLDMDLSLTDLATALDVYPHYITQILNTIFNQNFYEFINSYRTEGAKKELINPENKNLTILAIAYNCGFNSKSSFNRIFKQRTGQTPTEYRKTIS